MNIDRKHHHILLKTMKLAKYFDFITWFKFNFSMDFSYFGINSSDTMFINQYKVVFSGYFLIYG